mmetsp:Transcript_29605/g.78394  ORF Transcript_29605/g.78394 Transcript_29605/m.78394 type:complete len:206 (+) Transcript_29605:286-903(+)
MSFSIFVLARAVRLAIEKLSFAKALPCITRSVLEKVSMLTSPSCSSWSQISFQMFCCSYSEIPISLNFSMQRSWFLSASEYSSYDNMPLPSVSISVNMSQRSSMSLITFSFLMWAFSSSSCAECLKVFLTMTAVMRFSRISVTIAMTATMNTRTIIDFFIKGRAMSDHPSRHATWKTVTMAVGTSLKYFMANSSSSKSLALPPTA